MPLQAKATELALAAAPGSCIGQRQRAEPTFLRHPKHREEALGDGHVLLDDAVGD